MSSTGTKRLLLEPRFRIHTIGIDLAEAIAHLVGMDARGELVVRKKFSRLQLLRFRANRPACLIGMEACGGSNKGRMHLRRSILSFIFRLQ